MEIVDRVNGISFTTYNYKLLLELTKGTKYQLLKYKPNKRRYAFTWKDVGTRVTYPMTAQEAHVWIRNKLKEVEV